MNLFDFEFPGKHGGRISTSRTSAGGSELGAAHFRNKQKTRQHSRKMGGGEGSGSAFTRRVPAWKTKSVEDALYPLSYMRAFAPIFS